MPLDIMTIPCRTDNYAFLVQDPQSGRTALIDAPETAPIDAALTEKAWGLDEIWITHHHADHVEGVDYLREKYGAIVIGSAADVARLPKLDRPVAYGADFDFAGHRVEVLDVSGHTIGHIAFHIPGAKAAFTADSLMALGCGRVFEGTFPQMWDSLSRLAALPPETVIYSGHEYTEANARFALTIEPGNTALISRAEGVAAARAAGKPTVPSTLSEELATNPFLRANLPEVKVNLGLSAASDVDAFAEIRSRKDRF